MSNSPSKRRSLSSPGNPNLDFPRGSARVLREDMKSPIVCSRNNEEMLARSKSPHGTPRSADRFTGFAPPKTTPVVDIPGIFADSPRSLSLTPRSAFESPMKKGYRRIDTGLISDNTSTGNTSTRSLITGKLTHGNFKRMDTPATFATDEVFPADGVLTPRSIVHLKPFGQHQPLHPFGFDSHSCSSGSPRSRCSMTELEAVVEAPPGEVPLEAVPEVDNEMDSQEQDDDKPFLRLDSVDCELDELNSCHVRAPQVSLSSQNIYSKPSRMPDLNAVAGEITVKLIDHCRNQALENTSGSQLDTTSSQLRFPPRISEEGPDTPSDVIPLALTPQTTLESAGHDLTPPDDEEKINNGGENPNLIGSILSQDVNLNRLGFY